MSEYIQVDSNSCKGCRLCMEVCPKDIYALSSERSANGYIVVVPVRSQECTGCQLCEMTCPEMAITVKIKEGKKGAT